MNRQEIVIKNLNKYYGKKQALCDIELTIGPGMFGLLGRNGAGKTTLMKTLATLLPKKSGHVSVCGIPLENSKEVRKIIGYLPQEFSMYPSMKVGEIMDYLGILSGMDKTLRHKRAQRLLEQVNLADCQNKKFRSLSGGMKRRLGIAQALLHDPKVLIVDEPTAGLDPEERIRFRNLLCEVAEKRIVILSTHIVGDIEASCENIAILNEGHMLYKGTVDTLLKTAQGKVYTKTIHSSELPILKREFYVTNMHVQGNTTQVRLLSDIPVPKAAAELPTIEDAYMYYLCSNSSEKQMLGHSHASYWGGETL